MAGSTNLFNFSVEILYQKVHHELLPYFLRNYRMSICVYLSCFIVHLKSALGALSCLLAELKMGGSWLKILVTSE